MEGTSKSASGFARPLGAGGAVVISTA